MRRIFSQRTKQTQQKLVDRLTHNILQTEKKKKIVNCFLTHETPRSSYELV